MLRKLSHHMRQNAVAWLALFVALGGTGAYAANTVGSADIIDGEVKSVDVANQDLTSSDIKDGSINTFDLTDGTGVASADVINNDLTGADIRDNTVGVNDVGSQQIGSDEVQNDSLLQSDIRAGAVTGDEVLDNSLTGTDINESTLNMPPTTTATFAGPPDRVFLDSGGSLTEVTRKNLPAGSYAVVATANTTINNAGDILRDVSCELRASLSTGGNTFIGGATDRRLTPDDQQTKASLSMNGGAQIGAGGGSVQLWCRVQPTITVSVDYAQIMIIRLDGFF